MTAPAAGAPSPGIGANWFVGGTSPGPPSGRALAGIGLHAGYCRASIGLWAAGWGVDLGRKLVLRPETVQIRWLSAPKAARNAEICHCR
jgi:hypothetical protein